MTEKLDYIYPDKSGYKIRIVSLVPNKPKRLFLVPPLVGASGILAIKTFRYFFREGCALMSFDYCGHCAEIDNKFSIEGTFTDTEIALTHASECARSMGIPLHVAVVCYGAIPLVHVLNKLKWPQEVKSMLSVSGLLGINEILSFDEYKFHLRKRGLFLENKAEFINLLSTDERSFVSNKQNYIEALTDYLLELFIELSNIISYKRFGILEYSRAEFYKTFYEFMTTNLPEKIVIPAHFPCLFFVGVQDQILNLQIEESRVEYLRKIKEIAPHAQLHNLKIDHFGRGKDHYLIGEEGMKFLRSNDAGSSENGRKK